MKLSKVTSKTRFWQTDRYSSAGVNILVVPGKSLNVVLHPNTLLGTKEVFSDHSEYIFFLALEEE